MNEIEKNEQKNGWLIALFLFQYSILIPLMAYIRPSILVAVTGLTLLINLFIINRGQKMSTKPLLFMLVMLIIVLCKVFFDTSNDFSLLFYYLTIACPAMCLLLFSFDVPAFLRLGYVLAIINFVINVLTPALPYYEYMRFGYGMLLTPIFIYVRQVYYSSKDIPKYQTVLNTSIGIVATIEVWVYGARGSFFALMLFFALDLLFINAKHWFRNGVLIAIGVVLYTNIIQIINILEKLSKKFGIYSYSLAKYKMQIVSGWERASSGRNILYNDALKKIQENPWWGNPIHIKSTDDVYVHNIFLQTAQDLGIIGLIILVLFLVYLLIMIISKKIRKEEKIMLAILFSLSIGRLMFSSVTWKRPEFWMLIAFGLTIRRFNPNKVTEN